MHILYDILLELDWSPKLAWWADFAAVSIILLVISWLLRVIARFVLVALFHRIAASTKTTIDDTLVENKFPKNI